MNEGFFLIFKFYLTPITGNKKINYFMFAFQSLTKFV